MEQINEAGVRRKEKTPGTVTEPPPPKPSSLGGSKSSAPLTACTSPSLLARPSVLPVGVCPTSASLLSSNSAWPEANSSARHAPRHHTHTHTRTHVCFSSGVLLHASLSLSCRNSNLHLNPMRHPSPGQRAREPLLCSLRFLPPPQQESGTRGDLRTRSELHVVEVYDFKPTSQRSADKSATFGF